MAPSWKRCEGKTKYLNRKNVKSAAFQCKRSAIYGDFCYLHRIASPTYHRSITGKLKALRALHHEMSLPLYRIMREERIVNDRKIVNNRGKVGLFRHPKPQIIDYGKFRGRP